MSDDFVIDNSVVMTWCFKEEDSQYTDLILNKLDGATALVPSIWPLEVTNVLLTAAKRSKVSILKS